MKQTSGLVYVALFCMTFIPGCATTTADLVGCTAGLAASQNVNGPNLLAPNQAGRLAIGVTGGGGKYSATLGNLRYALRLAENNDLNFSAGYFSDDNSADGKGLMVGAKYKISLAQVKGFHFASFSPEYAFGIIGYGPSDFRLVHHGEELSLYNSSLHMLGCNFSLGFKWSLLYLDLNLGPYFGWYTFHASQDGTMAFSAGRFSGRIGFEIAGANLALSENVFQGSPSDPESGDFLDMFTSLELGYSFGADSQESKNELSPP